MIATGTLGLGALAFPGLAQAVPVLGATAFAHTVASGEPDVDTMLLWMRYAPPRGDSAKLVLKLRETPDFVRIAATGAEITAPWRDWTAKVTVGGPKPGTRYYYRFIAADGTRSTVGTTKTLPDDDARAFKAAIFSCSNLGFGWFNAYAHAAARDDLDLSDPPHRLSPALRQLPRRSRPTGAARARAMDRAMGRSRERERFVGGGRAEPRSRHRGRLERAPRRSAARLSRRRVERSRGNDDGHAAKSLGCSTTCGDR